MPTLLNDDKDKQLQRNQIIAIVLMTVLMLGWLWLFPPATPVKPPAAKPVNVAAQPQAEKKESAEAAQEAPAKKTADDTPVGWLPPVAEAPADPAQDEITVSDANLELVFTRVGARLKQARVVLGKAGADSAQLVPAMPGRPDADLAYPLGLRFSDKFWGAALDRRRWDAVKSDDGRGVVFTLDVPGHARVTKSFRFPADGNVLQATVSFENLSAETLLLGLDTREPAVSLTWGPQVASGDLTKGVTQQFVWRKDGKNTYTTTANLKPLEPGDPVAARVPGPDWVAVWSAYFAVAFKPEFAGGEGWMAGSPKQFTMGLGAPRTEVAAGQSAVWDYQVYIGSTARQALAAAWPKLDTVQRFFTSTSMEWLDWFSKFLLGILNWFHNNVYANYGVAIIFLTVLVRMAVFPLTWKSMMSMKRMSALAPELEKIKAEVGEDQQEMQRRMMELYRERGVNPFGGCLPLLLQMPVFITLYRMLWSAFELRRAPFLWMVDLSEPDRLFKLPFSIPIPFSGGNLDAVNLLPILGAVAMLLSTEFMNPSATAMQNPQQKMMMRFMPVMFSVFMYNLASGLNLYILISTILGIAQSQIIQRMDIKVDTTKKKTTTAHRPQHFYAAAQARKRDAARETRREKEQRRSGRGPRND
jgi:YidC/Oxa1 family membrane protein insertase